MSKPLTAAAVQKLRAGDARLEIPDAGCRGLYLVIQPSGAKGWALRYRRPDGRPAKLALGSVYAKAADGSEPDVKPAIGGHLTLAAAHRLVTELQHEIAQGRDPGSAHLVGRERVRRTAQDAAANTFAGAVRTYADEYKVPRKGRKLRRWREIAKILGLDYPTAGGEPVIVRGGLVDRWGARPVAEIDGHDVFAVIDESRRIGIPGMSARNEGASDARGRKMGDGLGSLFKWLHRNRTISVNPCVGAYRPDAPPARDRVLTDAEIVKFWTAAETLDQPFPPLLKLLLLTGCRLREVAEMTRDELQADEWVIPGSRTKNGRPHVVHLTNLMRELIASAPRIEKSAFVFTKTGRMPVSGWGRTKIRLDEAMSNPAPWRLHDLRRTAATGMANIGIAPHIVEAVLNHISGARAGVAGTYNRAAYAPEKKAALERWSAHIEGLVGGKSATVVSLRRPS